MQRFLVIAAAVLLAAHAGAVLAGPPSKPTPADSRPSNCIEVTGAFVTDPDDHGVPPAPPGHAVREAAKERGQGPGTTEASANDCGLGAFPGDD